MIPTKVYPNVNPETGPTLKDVAGLIKDGKANNVIIMSGAGISTSCGIPDFRSPETGLYHNLQKYNLPHPQAIFEINYFVDHPEAFFQLAKELYPGNFTPSLTHFFFVLLHKKGVLKRVFSQNIDCLDQMAGLPQEMIVEAHGSFATAKCLECLTPYSMEELRPKILEGQVIRCSRPDCEGKEQALVKPDIVFFGEGLPELFFRRIADFKDCDLLIVLGTSLQVQPFARLVDRVPDKCPRLLINLEVVGEAGDLDEFSLSSIFMKFRETGFDFSGRLSGGKAYTRDAKWIGESDVGVLELAKELGWDEELVKLRQDWMKEQSSKEKEESVVDEGVENVETDKGEEERKPQKTEEKEKLIKEELKEEPKAVDQQAANAVENLVEKVEGLVISKEKEGNEPEEKKPEVDLKKDSHV
ncbi:NAD-dependent deacetylase sirtuin-2 [Atractiella rhizophila]|nr:NAD-dependent deacetylase sirtuin-2 [Atractiella rhizophila]